MVMEQQLVKPKEKPQLSPRGAGILGLVCGSVLAYMCVASPLIEAARHAQKVSITLKGAAITPLALAFGMVYTLLPNQATKIFGHPQEPTRFGYLFAFVFAVLGISLYFWLKSTLTQSGYVF